MSRRSRRWLSILMLGALAFAHLNLALAACAMDRGQLAQMLSQPADHECCDEAAAPVSLPNAPMTPAVCFSQTTSDLQVLGIPVSIDRAPAAAVLVLPAGSTNSIVAPRRSAPPPNAIPPRILLHSFLI